MTRIRTLTTSSEATAKRAQIFQAATVLLARDGLQALSFEGVAQESGISRQLIRYYFADIESLMVGLAEHCGRAYQDMLVAGIVEIDQVKRLDFFLDFFFDFDPDHPMPENLEAYDALIAFSVGSETLRGRMCDQYKTLGQVIIHELAITHPELEAHACEEISFVFVSMMHAHWSFVASLGHSRAHGHLARQAIGRIIDSYVADSPTQPVIDRPWERRP